MKDVRCGQCNLWKTPEDFYSRNGVVRKPCKQCCREKGQRYNEKIKEKNHQRYQREKPQRLAKQMEKAYGMTPVEYKLLLLDQNNACALCQQPFGKTKKRPHIDHDHKTGKVRGILHSQCNTLLGFANDDPTILAKGIVYLTKTKT